MHTLPILLPVTSRITEIVPGRAAPHIEFEGDWTDTERQLLRSAIADAEYLQAPSHTAIPLPWLCYCKRLSGLSVYIVHRSGWLNVLHAYRATELGLKILLFGGRPPNGSRGFTA